MNTARSQGAATYDEGENLSQPDDETEAQSHISKGWNMAVVILSKRHDEMETFKISE